MVEIQTEPFNKLVITFIWFKGEFYCEKKNSISPTIQHVRWTQKCVLCSVYSVVFGTAVVGSKSNQNSNFIFVICFKYVEHVTYLKYQSQYKDKNKKENKRNNNKRWNGHKKSKKNTERFEWKYKKFMIGKNFFRAIWNNAYVMRTTEEIKSRTSSRNVKLMETAERVTE